MAKKKKISQELYNSLVSNQKVQTNSNNVKKISQSDYSSLVSTTDRLNRGGTKQNIAPLPSTTISKNEVSNNTQKSFSFDINNKYDDGYKNTGKKIGDYIKDSSLKDSEIFQKDNKFYYYDSNKKQYNEITNKTGYDVKENKNTKKTKQTAPVSEHFTNSKQSNINTTGKFEEPAKTVKAREDKLGLADRLSVDFSGKSDEDKKKMEDQLVQQEKDNSRVTGVVKGLEDSGYIKTGAFDDGYQFGDLTKTIISTGGSILNSVGRGTMGMVEGVGDAINYVLAGAEDLVGLDDLSKTTRDFAKRNLVDEITMPSSEAYQDSVLGNKSDSIVESIGGMLPSIALGGMASTTKGATALTSGSMFTSSYGQGVSEAYANGATDEEAQTYGLINGIAETATEMMFGGLGKGSKALGVSKSAIPIDDALAQTVSSKFKSKLAQNLTTAVIKSSGEGFEEVASGILQGIGKKMTFESDKELLDILNDEQLLDQFIGGAVASGIMQTPSLVKSTKQDRSLATNYTDNEQKVVDNITDSRFNEQLKDNPNMSKKEQNQLRSDLEEQTKADLEQGNLTPTEIQNALGNDDYQVYQQESQRKQDLENQLKELQNKSATDMNYSEYNENNQKITDLQNEINSINLDDLKSKADTPVESRIQNNDYLLQRSYNNYQNNQSQKNVAFEYQPQTDSKGNEVKISDLEKNVYDSASKTINNTKESHNLADFVSKLSKDTGIQYEFTTSEDLKNRGYNLDNRVINGLNTDDGKILINVDSDSIINRVVGHETTHLFENTEDYQTLQNEVFEYAKTKGDFDKLKAELTEAYKNVKGANIDNELTSELVGQYVFSDTDFVQNLSKHRNIFQKVYDEIKHLYKMATAGSKEARQLEKVKRTFEKVYQNSVNASTENKYMITGKKGVENDVRLNSEDKIVIDWYNEAHKMKEQGYNNEQIRKKTGWFQDRENNWKFEISDNEAALLIDPQQNKKYKLSELLKHDDLYEMYPNLKNINVKFKNIKNNVDPKTNKQNIVAGYYNTLTNTISINNRLINMPKGKSEILNTLLHETQHIIQKTEGFNHGYPKNDVETYNINLGEQEAFDTENRRKLNYNQRRNIAPVSSLIEKDTQMNYNTSRGVNNEKVNSENKRFRLVQDTSELTPTTSIDQRRDKQNNTRGKGLENNVENSNASSFSLNSNAKRYDELLKTNYIEYSRKDNGDVRVNLLDSNNNLVNQLDLWSNTDAVKQFGERLGNQLYNYATDNNQKIYIGNDINNLGTETDYFMNHRPTETGITADDIINQNVESPMPEDMYDHPEWYFQMNEKSSQESVSVLRKIRGKPNAEITIYRATPGNKINRGDWVTLSKAYAEQHNESQFDGKANILEMKVKAKDVQFAGDDVNEFGYFPQEKYSLSKVDNQGNTLTKQQQKFFKDSKVRDENGNLKVMYHGTPNGVFNQFDKSFIGKRGSFLSSRLGFYFSEDKSYADLMAREGGKEQNPKVFKVYLNIKKPLNIFSTELFKESDVKKVEEQLLNGNYDGIIDEFGNAVVFNSNQIKNIDNQNPTLTEDIRYSLNNDNLVPLRDGEVQSQDVRNENRPIAPLPTNIKTNSQKAKVQNNAKVVTPTNNIQENKQEATSTNKTLNPTEIAQIRPENASTTPKIDNISVSTGDGKSHFFDNIKDKANMLSEDSKAKILSNDEVKYYKEVTNEDSLNKAFTKLAQNGEVETRAWFNKASEKATDVDVAEGWILMKQYENIGDYDGMVQVAKKMREIGTTAGQTVQAFNIMNRMTPEGMVKYAQSELSEAYEQMIKGKTKKWIDQHRSDFDLKPEEVQFIMDNMQEVATMKDGYDKKVKLAEIQKLMTDKLPPERGQGIKAWMRISMLFNPKTQVRNVLGNALIAPVNSFGDLFASGVDKLVSKKTGIRTVGKTSLKNYTKGMKKGLFESYNDFKNGINTRNIAGNRFEISEGKSFNDNTRIGKSLNRVDSLLSFMLDAGDRMFYEGSFVNSINNQMVLNNTDTVTQDMIDIATQEALSRTWQDNNKYTKAVLGIRKLMNMGRNYGLGDVLIPFAKTPANLTKAIVDYSPAGLVNTIVKGRKLKNAIDTGQFTPQMQHEFAQSLGKATAGTMLYVLGYALAKAGVISGESDDDKDVSNFMKNTMGVNSYSIKIGNKSFTYDWAQPLAAPLSIMANIVNSEDDKGQAMVEGIVSSLDSAGSILLEQSFLQSINEVLNDNDGVVSGVINQLLELPARAVPTFSKQIVDLIDGTQRTSFEYGNPLQSSINSIKAKIPGLSQTLAPSVDSMGREIQKYGGKNNIFNVFFNPANVANENVSESAKEIYRVYKQTGDTTILPRVAPYYVNSDGEKIILSSKQREKFQKKSGQLLEQGLDNMMKNNTYINASDEDKAEMINGLVNYSYNIAQHEVVGTELSQTYEKAYNFANNGGNIENYYIYKYSVKDMDSNEKEKYLYNSDFSDDQKTLLYENITLSDFTDESKYLNYKTAKQLGVDINNWLNYSSQEFKSDIAPTGKTVSGSRKKKLISFVNSLNLTIPQKASLIKMSYSSYDSYDKQIMNEVNSLNISFIDKAKMVKTLGFDEYDKSIINYVDKNYSNMSEKTNILKDLGFTVYTYKGRTYVR